MLSDGPSLQYMADRETVEYRFSAPRDLWVRWKDTVPRSKNLDERLIELIEADVDG